MAVSTSPPTRNPTVEVAYIRRRDRARQSLRIQFMRFKMAEIVRVEQPDSSTETYQDRRPVIDYTGRLCQCAAGTAREAPETYRNGGTSRTKPTSAT